MVILKKRGKLATETLIRIVALSVVAVVIVGILIVWQTGFDKQKLDETMCYVSNGMKSSTVSSIFPSTCEYFPVQEPIDLIDLSKLLTGLWHSHGQGDWGFSSVGDEAYLRYSFYLKEEISLSDLYKHLLTHKGAKVVSPKESDYNYLQSGSKGYTLCFDQDILEEDDNVLFKDQLYYVFFVDDVKVSNLAARTLDFDPEDKIVIMKTSDEGNVLTPWNGPFTCLNPMNQDVSQVGTLSWGVSSDVDFFGGKK